MARFERLFKLLSPFRIVILFLAVISAVILVIPQLKVNLLPEDNASSFDIYYTMVDAAPDIMEQQVTSVIEGACSQLSRLKKITSVSRHNSGYVRLEFDRHVDMQVKQFEVAAIIRRIYPHLATAVSYPLVRPVNDEAAQSPLLVYAVNAPLQPYYIREQAEVSFRKAFTGAEGIQEILISGTPVQQLVIRFDQEKCITYHLSLETIMEQVRSFFSPSYPGSITKKSGESYFMEIRTPAASAATINHIPVGMIGGQQVRVKDIAEVYMEEAAPADNLRVNGKNAVSVSFYARKGSNQISTAAYIKEEVQKISQQLPPGYTVSMEYDDSEFLTKEIRKNYQRALLSVSILLVFILLSYRKWRFLFNLLANLLVTLCLTVLLAWCFDVGIHLYSIAGIAISFGIITDNAIVMMDHYHRFRNRRIFTALMAATCTTIAALILVFFLPENERKNLADFALIVILALLASLITALCFIPGLYTLTLSHRVAERPAPKFRRNRLYVATMRSYHNCIHWLSGYRRSFVCVMLLAFGLPFFLLPVKWEGGKWYHAWYNTSFGSDHYQDKIRPVVDKWTGGTLRLFVDAIYEKSGYRSPEKTKLYVNAGLPIGSTAIQMDQLLSDIEKNLDHIKGIRKYITRVYSGLSGNIEIIFEEKYERSAMPFELKAKLIDLTLNRGNVEWSVYGVGQGFSNGNAEQMAGNRIIMKGYNYEELGRQAALLGELLQQHNRVQKVNTNDRLDYSSRLGMEYFLHLDRNQTALQQVTEEEVLSMLKTMTRSNEVDMQLLINDKYYPVVFREKNAAAFSGYDALHQSIQLDSIRKVTVHSIGKLELNSSANSISKENRQYLRAVTFDFAGSAQLTNHYIADVVKKMKQLMPVGYTAERDIPERNWTREQRNYLFIGLVMLTIFLICSVLFENVKTPLFIITMIPLSFIGLFLTFRIGGFYFDHGGYAAFIMLSGLVANAAIFIANDFYILKRKYGTHDTAFNNRLIIKAVQYRARTILLTTFSTCCGLIPFILEGQKEVFWFSLAVGTIGGLIFSLPVIFIVLPVLLYNRQRRSIG